MLTVAESVSCKNTRMGVAKPLSVPVMQRFATLTHQIHYFNDIKASA